MTTPPHNDQTPPDPDGTGNPGDLGDLGSHDDGFDDHAEGGTGAAFTMDDEPVSGGLFPGDTSELTYEQRHTLNVILKTPFLSGATHRPLWRTLLEDPAPFVTRLHDLFLDLEIDRVREIAIKRPIANPGGDRFPTLFYDSRLNREETIVVLCLRRHYRNERAAGADRVFIDVADIHDFAENLRPPTATDISGDKTRVTNAVQAVRKSGLLVKTREDDRFEISAAIEILLPMHKLQALLADLQRKNGTAPAGGGADDTPEAAEAAGGPDSDDDLFTHGDPAGDPAGNQAGDQADVDADDVVDDDFGPGPREDEEQQP